eukprot:jgi/Mesvir1/13285/Mv25634-RA.1
MANPDPSWEERLRLAQPQGDLQALAAGKIPWTPVLASSYANMSKRMLVLEVQGKQLSQADKRAAAATVAGRSGQVIQGLKGHPNIEICFFTPETAKSVLDTLTTVNSHPGVTVGGTFIPVRYWRHTDLAGTYHLTLHNVPGRIRTRETLNEIFKPYGSLHGLNLPNKVEDLPRTGGGNSYQAYSIVCSYTPRFEPDQGLGLNGTGQIYGCPGGYSGTSPRCLPDILQIPIMEFDIAKLADSRVTTQINMEPLLCITCMCSREHLSNACPEALRLAAAKQQRLGGLQTEQNPAAPPEAVPPHVLINRYIMGGYGEWDLQQLDIPKDASVGSHLYPYITSANQPNKVLCTVAADNSPSLLMHKPMGARTGRPLDIWTETEDFLKRNQLDTLVQVSRNERRLSIMLDASIDYRPRAGTIYILKTLVPCLTSKEGDFATAGARLVWTNKEAALKSIGVTSAQLKSILRRVPGANYVDPPGAHNQPSPSDPAARLPALPHDLDMMPSSTGSLEEAPAQDDPSAKRAQPAVTTADATKRARASSSKA